MTKLLTFLNQFIENEFYEELEGLIGNFVDLFSLSENEDENIILTSLFFKNLIIIYLYISNYPYMKK